MSDVPTDRRVQRGLATRDRLIETARQLFGEHGYDGTSIDAILRSAGIQRGALYHHFDSKRAVFDAVLTRVMAEIAAEVVTAARTAADPAASLRAGCMVWLHRSLDPAIQRIVLLDPPSVLGWTRQREIDRQYVSGVRRNLEQMTRASTPGEVEVLTHMLLAAVGEAALYIALSDDPRAALAAGEAAVDRFLRAVPTP
ncbi:TetR/AcrR family transcriptional regulator [Virgisporangium aurantiacum]|uniref:TetR family transcriptional regulator n=1 Tax=Virgisporangium aurantiacum TaxID=175570 RepID=A0A8J4E3G6_9ACTN|nr:TetR/AcrR family transcriptional regulator [Virgisporangium aurantiacum]GIJ60086.1 TetR family transcriptional regulator [Virgisporangium aurantiacum]